MRITTVDTQNYNVDEEELKLYLTDLYEEKGEEIFNNKKRLHEWLVDYFENSSIADLEWTGFITYDYNDESNNYSVTIAD